MAHQQSYKAKKCAVILDCNPIYSHWLCSDMVLINLCSTLSFLITKDTSKETGEIRRRRRETRSTWRVRGFGVSFVRDSETRVRVSKTWWIEIWGTKEAMGSGGGKIPVRRGGWGTRAGDGRGMEGSKRRRTGHRLPHLHQSLHLRPHLHESVAGREKMNRNHKNRTGLQTNQTKGQRITERTGGSII